MKTSNRTTLEDPLWFSGMTLAYQMEGRWFESAAQQKLLSQKGFEYVTMNPLLPAKVVGPQPANVPLRNEL